MGALHRLKGSLRRFLYRSLIPSRYREIVDELEAAVALQTSDHGEESDYWAQKLRQAAHIVEKGLQRDDYEPGHSLTWYKRARDALSHIPETTVAKDPSLIWATSRLEEYERLQCGEQPARRNWVAPEAAYREALLQVIKARRSIRRYLCRLVDVEVIEEIVKVANWSPTSCNRQPAKVFAVNSPSLARLCLGTCQGATGFSVFVPCFLSFCVDLRAYDLPREMELPLIDASLGAQNCCLLAHSLGLSITLLSWASHSPEDERRLRSLLGIPHYFKIVVNAALGYPEYQVAVPFRKPIESTLVLVEPRVKAPSSWSRIQG